MTTPTSPRCNSKSSPVYCSAPFDSLSRARNNHVCKRLALSLSDRPAGRRCGNPRCWTTQLTAAQSLGAVVVSAGQRATSVGARPASRKNRIPILRSSTTAPTEHAFVGEAKRLLEAARVRRPPVDLEELAILRGVNSIRLSNTLNASGQLIRGKDGLTVVLNAKEPVERRRFSLAHEIAHTFALGRSPSQFRLATETTDCLPLSREEYLCDRAAAEMLMPEKFFTAAARRLPPAISSLVELSKIFGSSLRASIVRIGQVGVWPAVLIVWQFRSRIGSTPKLRVAWSAKPSGTRCYIPRYAAADPDSSVSATFACSHPTTDFEMFSLGSLRGRFLVENARFSDYVVSVVHHPNLQRGV